MIDFKKPENIFFVALIIAFFMPWVDFYGIVTVNGYQLPNINQFIEEASFILLEGISIIDAILGVEPEPLPEPVHPWVYWSPYAIPLTVCYGLGKQFLGFEDWSGEYDQGYALSPGIVGLFISWSYVVDNPFTGSGALITFVTSIILIIIGLSYEFKNSEIDESEEPWGN
tara:strand:- start:67 stop:576 length:510 start_codon:yes stop_codon:yes gene_type:complete